MRPLRFIFDLFASLNVPNLPLRTERQWQAYYRDKVEPLRMKLASTKLGDIRENERYRALFVLTHGENSFSFIEALSIYPAYTVQQLCAYIDREAPLCA
jgi:hypothetical protein